MRLPAPVLSSEFAPFNAPLTVKTWLFVSSVPPPGPMFTARVRLKSASAVRPPPSSVNVPVPSRDSASMATRPPLMVTAPVKLFDPVGVNVPVPIFARSPAPVMAPGKRLLAPP